MLSLDSIYTVLMLGRRIASSLFLPVFGPYSDGTDLCWLKYAKLFFFFSTRVSPQSRCSWYRAAAAALQSRCLSLLVQRTETCARPFET